MACEPVGPARLTDHGDNLTRAPLDASRLAHAQLDHVAAVGGPHFNLALEDVSPAAARAIDFHAELGAEIGDHGGGSADGEQVD